MIFAVDDFGKNQKTNQNILALVKLKKMRVAILIDGNFSSQDIAELKESKALLDIHLGLERLTGSEKSKQNPLKRILHFLFKYFFGKYSTQKICAEWENQIERFKNIVGKYPDGVNSHEHVHFFPQYFKIALALSKKFKISYIRFGRNGLLKKNNITANILNILWRINLKNFKKSSLASSQFMMSLDWIKNPDQFIEKNENSDVEIVCHPERKEEFEILKKM